MDRLHKYLDLLLCFLFGHDWGPNEHMLTCFHTNYVVCPHWTKVCQRKGCDKHDLGYYPGPLNAQCRQLAKKGYCPAVNHGMDKSKLYEMEIGAAACYYARVRLVHKCILIGWLVWLIIYCLSILVQHHM